MAKQEKRIIRRRLANAYLSSVVSISLVLMLTGLASALIMNARSVADYFKENMQMSVLLKQEVSENGAEKLASKFETCPYVKTVRVVSREEGTVELEKMLGEDFLSVFETSPVPVSIELTLNADYVSSDSLAIVEAYISANQEVDEIDCQQSLVEALNSNLARISFVLAVLIALLLFISFVLISNTVRLSVFSRRFTIYTMKMVGATLSFIRRPFMKDAVLQGLAASVLATLCLGVGLIMLKNSFSQLFEIFKPQMLLAVVLIVFASGAVICSLSTFFVVGKLVSSDKDELYF